MDHIVIEGVRPYDGAHEFDLVGSEFTTREWGWIKRLSGYMPLTIEQGFDGADPELFCCFAVIALRRNGKITDREVSDVFARLTDAPFGSTIRMELDQREADEEEEGADAGPPASSSNGSAAGSGGSSPTSSETSEPTRHPSGTPASVSSESPPGRSET